MNHPDAYLLVLQKDPQALLEAWRKLVGGRWPGRGEALVRVARALGRRVPECEYQLPENSLDALLARARRSVGARVPLRGASRHKGRVGDGIERLILGGRVSGGAADHPAAEIKSVPVRGHRVIERVKLGVVHALRSPLEKCARVLFVFVERRGLDHFVRGFVIQEFCTARWQEMWRRRHLVETAAGSPARPARGLYLTPHFFYDHQLWPPR